jgi:hypothetical protein
MASSPATIEPEWGLFSRTRFATLTQVKPLSQEEMDWRPAPHKWSTGEIVDHLLLSEVFWRGEIAKLIELARAGRRPVLRRSAGDLNVAVFFIPRPLLGFFSIPFELFNLFMPRDLRNWLLSQGLIPMRNPDVNEPQRNKPAGELRKQLLSHLSETKALLEANADLNYHQMIHRHPSLGVNDAPEILNLLSAHEERHQGQMREVLRLRRLMNDEP